MAGDQLKRFARWQRLLPKRTAYLVARVIEEVVPVFEQRGFARYADYAAGNTFAVRANNIPLQRRSGAEWPTVEILFHGRMAPSLGVTFAALPEICCRHTLNGPVEIPRPEACIVEGLAFFSLCKGSGKNFDCNFGYRWFALFPMRKLDAEIAVLKSLLPWLFDTFDAGIPSAWLAPPARFVHKHAFLSPASKRFQEMMRAGM
jgi:hypothetical protein